MFLNSNLHISHGLTDVTVAARTVSFIDLDHMWSMSVLGFQNKKAFYLFSLPKDDEEAFVSAAVRDLDKNFWLKQISRGF